MFREDFKILNEDLIYFDSGATTQKPNQVIEEMNKYYTEYCANAHRGDYNLSYIVDEKIYNTRELVKKFINATNSNEIVFTSGTTESLNIIVNGFFYNNLEPGDEIILTKSEHASNVMPWFRLAKELGCIIKFIPLDENYHVTLDNLIKVITPKTKVISIAHITNVIGDIRPIKEISKYAHDNNIFVVVDGAQSVPHIKVDVQELDCDFLCFSAHKMCGPTGIGILYGKYELLNAVEPQNLGGGMNDYFDDIDNVSLKELPFRLEAGTINIAGIIGLGACIDYLNKIGMDKIHKYEIELKDHLISSLLKLPHIDIINLNSDTGIVSINVNNLFSQDVAYYLNKYNICVRAGNHCAKILNQEIGTKSSIRISLYFYNTIEEIDNLIELLSDYSKIEREMI